MGLSGVLEAIIGLVFIYFLVSVLCSGLNEAIAQETGRRGRFLREGLINIVRDRWLFLRLINHPLVSSLYRDVPGKPRTPSYSPPTISSCANPGTSTPPAPPPPEPCGPSTRCGRPPLRASREASRWPMPSCP